MWTWLYENADTIFYRKKDFYNTLDNNLDKKDIQRFLSYGEGCPYCRFFGKLQKDCPLKLKNGHGLYNLWQYTNKASDRQKYALQILEILREWRVK